MLQSGDTIFQEIVERYHHRMNDYSTQEEYDIVNLILLIKQLRYELLQKTAALEEAQCRMDTALVYIEKKMPLAGKVVGRILQGK